MFTEERMHKLSSNSKPSIATGEKEELSLSRGFSEEQIDKIRRKFRYAYSVWKAWECYKNRIQMG